MTATRIFLITLLSLGSYIAKAQQLIDPQATKETQVLYKNLHLLQNKKYTLFGHQDDLAYGVKWDNRAHPMSGTSKSDIDDVIGDFPAVYGWDLGYIEKNSPKNIDGVSFEKMRDYIRAGYDRGAVITLSWHFDNPLTGGSTWDTTKRTVASILPGGAKHVLFKTWLDRASSFISTLKGPQGEAIPVLFRPFHELNGDWFWWGKNKATADEFKAIWKFTINYLRKEKDLHNLIIVYNTNSFKDEAEFLEKYPGDNMADVLSFDKYQFTKDSKEFITTTRKELSTVARLAEQKNKLAAFAETGYEALPDAQWWTKTLAPTLKGIPISYVLVWRNAGYMPSMKKMHYYAPYPGQASAADFKKFYQKSIHTVRKNDKEEKYLPIAKMNLQLIDISILIAYLVTMVLIGIYMRNKAKQDKESYLLGGKKLPWYMLGLSDASDMFDISGTMWMVALCFVYGLKSIWIPWLWPVFNQVFMMMFLSKWLRRSNANTGAEWLQTRFGLTGKGVRGSHMIVIAFALISCLGFLAYGFVGLGKFMQVFIPWDVVKGYVPFEVTEKYVPHFYGIVFTLFAMFYSILGGLHSIVLGDAIKYGIMTIACVCIGVIAVQHLQGQTLNVPKGWNDPFFSWNLDLDWSKIAADANKKIADDGYSLFGLFFMMMLMKGVFASLAGPAPNYDMQKVLSTRSPKEASKMTGFVSIILLPIRYSMITGLTVLALLYYNQLYLKGPDGVTDFERILPATINNFLPVGVLGLVLTGLLGAFMGTFSGTLNAAQAYIVNDIYLKYINKNASNKKVMRMNYLSGVVVVIVGVFFGFLAKDVNDILQWIVGGLYGGYVAANCLKWYWWRFNANGFFYGMAVGIVSALLMPYVTTGLPLYWWPLLFVLSMAGCIIGTYAAPPTDVNVLKSFYKNVRPWGFWKPIHELVIQDDPTFVGNKGFALDMSNVGLGIIAQLCLTIFPMYLIMGMYKPLAITVAILVVIAVILKRTWWNRLED